MQSGKTGTYLFTALEMIRQGLVENVIIICGSSDTSLRSQATKDLSAARGAYLDEIDPEGNLPRRLTDMYENLNVFFSQDLGKAPAIKEKTLIIHDESHMAQSKNNIPFKSFYRKNNLDSALMGDFKILKEGGNYILGVSATPFSEIVANKKVQKKDWTTEENSLLKGVNLDLKNFYFMKPGSDYIGVTELIRTGAIKFEADEIKIEECKHIASVLRKNFAKYERKYVVIRTHRAEKDKNLMRTIAAQLGYDYISVFGGENTDLEFLDTQPFKATLVHICGRFRMGQVVPKRNIAMAYEQSQRPNADTILQGLVGRMCGYQSAGAHTDIDIYVAPSAEELIRKYHHAWETGEMDTLSEITRAMNLGGTKRKNGGIIVTDKDGTKWIQTVPISFNIRQLEKDFGDVINFNKIDPNDIINLLSSHEELISENPDKEEILKLLNWCARCGTDNYLHHNKSYHMHKSTAELSKVTSDECYANLNEAVSQSKRMNLSSYTKSDLKSLGDTQKVRYSPISLYGSAPNPNNPEGVCYLMGFVHYDPVKHPPESVELAEVHPNCNYVPSTVKMEDHSVIEKFNGGQIITFSLDTAADPCALERELHEAILRTTEGHESYIPSCSRSIHSLQDDETTGYKGIRLEKSVYTDEIIQEVTERLNRKHSITLTLKKSRGRQPTDYIKYASISW